MALIFPLYEISVRDNLIILKKDTKEYSINRDNFGAFKKIISAMFSLNLGNDIEEYNPSGEMSKRIAEKFKKRHEQLDKIAAKKQKNETKIAILSKYASILAVGLQKDLNEIMQYTTYQLYDEFQRFQLKLQWDAYIQARMAGAKDLEEVDNWMIDLQDQKQKNKTKNKK